MGKQTVTQSMDQKIYDLIHLLLDEQTKEKQAKSISDDQNDPFQNMALAKDLKIGTVIEYIQRKDFKLRRMKRAALEKNAESVLKLCREDEAEELGELGVSAQSQPEGDNAAEVDSDFEGDMGRLVSVTDSNALNKSVVSLWNTEANVATEKDSLISENPVGIVEGGEGENDSNGSKKRPSGSGSDSNSSGSSTQVAENKKPKRSRSKIDHTTPTITLSSLGGLEGITTQLMELIGLPILHPEIYLSTGVEPPRGVLLYGPPGCGKTTIANALAGELQVPFINILAPSVVSGMSGESEKKLREIFDEAKSLAPCLVFMDEIDAITPKRDGGAQREMERRIVAQLLTLMDELSLEKTDGKPVIVIGATNRPDSLDLALRRAGRFDREICLNVPNEDQRYLILKTMTRNLKLGGNDDFNFRELAKMTPGFVGADLKSLVTAAGIAAIKRIFETMSELETEEATTADAVDAMEIDTLAAFEEKLEFEKLSTIQRFLKRHPDSLTPDQLEPLHIEYVDFVTALPTIQPTAKREGFATIPDVSWQDVGALTNIRMELHMCIVQPIKKPELYEKVGITAPAGVLMWGPPGCGKTLLAKAVANESRANFISIKGPELLNKYVGESERAVRQVFQRARASVPCIIFFDELDALVPRRDTLMSELSSRVVNTLLTELDGLNDRKGIFVIGATNRPDMIDLAMLRPGRLDKTLYIELPSASERFDILKTLIKANGTPLGPMVDLGAISNDERCRNFSGADLSSLVREAGVLALKKKFFKGQKVTELDASGYYYGEEQGEDDTEIEVTTDDFARALDHIHPSVSDKDRARYERLNKRMGWTIMDKEKEDEPKEETA